MKGTESEVPDDLTAQSVGELKRILGGDVQEGDDLIARVALAILKMAQRSKGAESPEVEEPDLVEEARDRFTGQF